MSNSFLALIWWVVPAIGLVGAFGYVLWVTKFQGKYQHETQRSVGNFRRFQDSLRESQVPNHVDQLVDNEEISRAKSESFINKIKPKSK